MEWPMARIDRISALLEEIRVSILSLLPITDAVRTSVLSRSWVRLWTFLPGLHIDYSLFHTSWVDALRSSKGPFVNVEERLSCWVRIVERLLSSLCGPIRYFMIFNIIRSSRPHLNRFLDFIFQKGGLEKLTIINAGLFQLPCYGSLKDLHLYWVRISLPTNFQGLDQLTTLTLQTVFISEHDINLLVNSSKNLTSFQGEDLRSLHIGETLLLTFNCPLLKSISFQFGSFRVDARVASAPCLESVYVCVGIKDNVYSPKELALLIEPVMKFMADIAHVSCLYLDSLALECLFGLYVGDVPRTFRVHFNQLRCLKLDTRRFYAERRMYEMFCDLLRSMPCLDQLLIMDYDHAKDKFADPIPSNKYLKNQDGFHCLDQTLTRVEVYMNKLTDLNHIMWMMYLILLNAKVLEVLKIAFSKDDVDDPQVISRITKKLCAVEKASLDAKVVFVAGDAKFGIVDTREV